MTAPALKILNLSRPRTERSKPDTVDLRLSGGEVGPGYRQRSGNVFATIGVTGGGTVPEVKEALSQFGIPEIE